MGFEEEHAEMQKTLLGFAYGITVFCVILFGLIPLGVVIAYWLGYGR